MRPVLLLALLSALACATPRADGPAPPARLQLATARAKLARLSSHRAQLWVVVHVRAHKTLRADGTVDEPRLIETAVRNARAVVEGGGDMVILINSRCEMPLYERVLAAVRAAFPQFPLGISALSYGPQNLTEGFRLAEGFHADLVWTEVVPGQGFEWEDDDGSYKPGAVTPVELALGTQARVRPAALHVSGVHMKYTRPTDGRSFDTALRDALGTVDGINITGAATGVLADVERVRRARELAGAWPMGLASGVSTENIASVLPYIDYAIVGTSLKEPGDPLLTSAERVRALRAAMNARDAQ
ncbi:MAG: hypothetical protein HY904_10365 [Deltaproteobacteria bacterium]|nr:hypothetical protein [Deltaproteobacteria bacterium]